MQIHSKFHDYYDTAMGMGIDTTIHYNRTQQEFLIRTLRWELPKEIAYVRRAHSDTTIEYETFVIGFCGRLYPCVRMVAADGQQSKFIYTADEDYQHLAESLGPKWKIRLKWASRLWGRERLDEFISSGHIDDRPFIEVNAPIFIIRDTSYPLKLSTNPSLKKIEFYKVSDAFTTFQDIASYLTNTLVRRESLIEIADKHKIEQHGFDKYSFRKPPKS